MNDLAFDLSFPPDQSLCDAAAALFTRLELLDLPTRIATLNSIRLELHKHSPFSTEPVDCVQWIEASQVTANDYNPNSVAPPEMQLLEHSILSDGYTQPIVAWQAADGPYEVIDGFHRNRVGRECLAVANRVHGYLPLAVINNNRTERNDRIAATIRHNRARGKHQVEAMSDIVIELKRRNWNDEKIGRELGMDPDEVLRLCQITGLAEAFANQEFSQAWEVDRDESGSGGEIISDVISGYEAADGARILHTWDKWECYRAGFYAERPPNGMTQDQGEESYRIFLSNLDSFDKALSSVTNEWNNSCEHYLTNERMNRVAWLGQASMAYAQGIPSCCRGGYNRLSQDQKYAADQLALRHLNAWLELHGKDQVMLADAVGRTEAELY